MINLVVIGAGGLGREVVDVIRRGSNRVLGFIDEAPESHGKMVNSYPILGGVEWFKENQDTLAVCAIGNNYVRKAVTDRARECGAKFTYVIDPSASIGYGVKIGKGVIVVQGSTVTSNVVIGNHVIINIDSSVAHDDILEEYVNISPGVQLSGNVTVKEGATIHTGATVKQGITIGRWAEVAMGAAVIKDVPDHMLVAGIPAVIKKDLRTRPTWRAV